MGALRIVQRNALVYRRVWRGSLFFNFLQPSLFLVSMGLGVGALVGRGGATFPGGVSFLAFLAPGLLASTCMQTAAFESSFPVVSKMTWRRNYEAISATPVLYCRHANARTIPSMTWVRNGLRSHHVRLS